MIRLQCNDCGARLKVREDQIGRTLKCPRCGTKIQVPPAEPMAHVVASPPPPIGAAVPVAPPAPPTLPPPAGAPAVHDEAPPDPGPPPVPELFRPKPRLPLAKSPADSALPPEQEAIVHRVIDSLIRAFSAGKLAFFGLGTLANCLVTTVLCALVAWLVYETGSTSVMVLFVVPVLTAIGLGGVVAGGVAFMFLQERKGRPHGIAAGIRFCAKRFVTLFVDTIVAILIGLMLSVGLNLTIQQLNTNKEMGSLIGAVLFLPQIVCNVLLLLALLTSVLVPCIVAVTDARPFGALTRFFRYLGQHGRPLLVHFAASFLFGIQIFIIILPLLGYAFSTTFGTNAPATISLASLVGSGEESLFASGEDHGLGGIDDGSGAGLDNPFRLPGTNLDAPFGVKPSADSDRQQKGAPWGDGLRWLGLVVAVFVPFSYLCVFWIGSFTRFSEDLEAPPDLARDIRVDVSVD